MLDRCVISSFETYHRYIRIIDLHLNFQPIFIPQPISRSGNNLQK